MKRLVSLFDYKVGEGFLFFEFWVFFDVILDLFVLENFEIREVVECMIKEVYNLVFIIFNDVKNVLCFVFFNILVFVFCYGCYEEEWFIKIGGMLGIKYLFNDIDFGD